MTTKEQAALATIRCGEFKVQTGIIVLPRETYWFVTPALRDKPQRMPVHVTAWIGSGHLPHAQSLN